LPKALIVPPVFVLLLFLVGCGAAPPQFVANTEGREPATVPPEQAQEIAQTLESLFGTPDEPRVPPGVPLKLDLLQAAAGPVGGDAAGNGRGLFRRHCVACHGLTGDGTGPTAISVSPPYPRDFRRGIFKYSSTRGGAKPLTEDLRRTLLRGIPGTAMPSFIHLKDGPGEELDAVLEYVKYLAIRGETESYLFRAVVDDEDPSALEPQNVLDDAVLPLVRSWALVEEDRATWVVVPPPPPPTENPQDLADSIAQGRALYLTAEAQCSKCHGREGDGKGDETEIYDDWNKPKKGLTPEETAALARRFTLPIEQLRPRDFRQGIFHGGSSPADLYRRIAVGIKGTPMPGLLGAPGAPNLVKPEEIWHLVNFVRSKAQGIEEAQLREQAQRQTKRP
jgi:mono/diheme cytochrome c family protein